MQLKFGYVEKLFNLLQVDMLLRRSPKLPGAGAILALFPFSLGAYCGLTGV